jgi:AcrR family transcriptional regulator
MARADRNRQLVSVAREVFAQRGFAGTSVDEIAERAGVSKPVIYDHFRSKDGLLAAVLTSLGLELGAKIAEAARDAATPRDSLAQGLHAYFEFVGPDAHAWSLMLTEVATGTVEAARALEDIRETQAAFIAAMILKEMPEPDAAQAAIFAEAVVGAVERLAAVRRRDPSLTADRAADSCLALFWLGFEAMRAGVRVETERSLLEVDPPVLAPAP